MKIFSAKSALIASVVLILLWLGLRENFSAKQPSLDGAINTETTVSDTQYKIGKDALVQPINDKQLMRAEFMESCQARREYTARKRAGTLHKYCKCIFNKTMKGLPDDTQMIAAHYLYGEGHPAFKARLKSRFSGTAPDMTAMGIAAKAIDKAVKTCR